MARRARPSSHPPMLTLPTMNLLENLFGFERAETQGEVIFTRLFELFVAVFSIKLAWTWSLMINGLSDIVLPLGIAHYVDVSILFDNGLAFVNAALISVFVILGFSRIWRYAYLAGFLLLHLQFAARYTLGEIPHSSNVLGFTLLAFALGIVLFDAERFRRRFAMGLTYFSIGLGYTSAAFCKLIATGITWPDGRHLWMWINEKSIDTLAETGALQLNGLQELALDHWWIATAFLTVGMVSEFFAFTMWWRRFRTLALLAVLGLHAGIYLTMDIVFGITTAELILLALPWAKWIDATIASSDRQRLRSFRQLVNYG